MACGLDVWLDCGDHGVDSHEVMLWMKRDTECAVLGGIS